MSDYWWVFVTASLLCTATGVALGEGDWSVAAMVLAGFGLGLVLA